MSSNSPVRVHVICEGQTEEAFVNDLLFDYFFAKDIQLIPSLVGKPGHKGGNFKFQRLLPDLKGRLQGDKQSYCTTFFDFYGLPEDFPGKSAKDEAATIEQKSAAIVAAMQTKLADHISETVLLRFIPYVQMYEFEALLFSSPEKFAQGIDRPELADSFAEESQGFSSPEHINNSAQTAPSKRVLKYLPNYEKPLLGSLAALEIGLPVIRQHCKLFDAWLKQLEALAGEV